MKKSENEAKGISANALVLPISVTVAVLHIMIISLIFAINTASAALSVTMQKASVYAQDATSLLAGSSLLSETVSHYVLMPVTESGEINVNSLASYANELGVDRRGYQVMARFQTYGVDEDVLALLSQAAESANQMLDAQLHAISLVNSLYPIPQVDPLTMIPLRELTEEEAAMTEEQKMSAARTLVLGSVYGLNKKSVYQNVNACVGLIQQRSAQVSAQASQRLAILREAMWIVTLTIILILACTFAALYSGIMRPLGRFVKLIPQDQPLDEKKGFREVRLVAGAYNGVLKRRDTLDQILRSAAETDALTNLPNRYRFEQYLVESEDSGSSMAVVLFDVNYLKRTNDTQGHLAGDRLIRHAADCIASCFGENCFRFGGDEFAAIVKDCTPETIKSMVRRFEEMEKTENVSISLGYAYTDQIGKTTVKRLIDEADKKMYEQKKTIHRER